MEFTILFEIKAPEGYVLDNTQHEFSITEHKQVVDSDS